MGGQEATIIRAAAERGHPIPSTIANAPELWSINLPIWNAFWQLSRSRPLVSTGMGVTLGRLPYLDKSMYAKDHDFADTPDELDDFLYLIDGLDAEYLKLNAPRQSTPTRRGRTNPDT